MSDCGIGGEDCSLCMVSAVAPAKWIRWMLVQEDPDPPNIIRVARGAPARWINSRTPFGISHAPTRQGQVSFSLARAAQGLTGTVSFAPNAGQPCIARRPSASRVVQQIAKENGGVTELNSQMEKVGLGKLFLFLSVR